MSGTENVIAQLQRKVRKLEGDLLIEEGRRAALTNQLAPAFGRAVAKLLSILNYLNRQRLTNESLANLAKMRTATLLDLVNVATTLGCDPALLVGGVEEARSLGVIQ